MDSTTTRGSKDNTRIKGQHEDHKDNTRIKGQHEDHKDNTRITRTT